MSPSAWPRLASRLALPALLLLGAASLGAQVSTSAGTQSSTSAGSQTSSVSGAQADSDADAFDLPEETKSENPLRRFEIVSLGSYPITLFYVGFMDDFRRYSTSGWDASYLPWNSGSSSLSNSERIQRLEAALCFSVAIGAIDAIIHAEKVKKAKRLREAKLWADAEDDKAPRHP